MSLAQRGRTGGRREGREELESACLQGKALIVPRPPPARKALPDQCMGTVQGLAVHTLGSGPIDFRDFTAMTIRTKQLQLVVIQVYVDAGIGVKGTNIDVTGQTVQINAD